MAPTPPSPRTRRSRAPGTPPGAVETLDEGIGQGAGNGGDGPGAAQVAEPQDDAGTAPTARPAHGRRRGRRHGGRGPRKATCPDPTRARPAPPALPAGRAPGGIRWTRMLLIGVVCFAVWLLLDAPSLQRSATSRPLGHSPDGVPGRGRAHRRAQPGPRALPRRGLDRRGTGPDPGRWPHPGQAPPPAPARPRRGHRHSRRDHRPSRPTDTLPPLDHPPDRRPIPCGSWWSATRSGSTSGSRWSPTWSATGVVTATLDGRIDTGLSRPDYFNWPAELRVDLANDRPQLVVVMMGRTTPSRSSGRTAARAYGSPGWNAAYGRRVGAFIDEAEAAGAHVLWVGMPPMAAPRAQRRHAGPQQRGAAARSPPDPGGHLSRRPPTCWATARGTSPPTCPTARAPR